MVYATRARCWAAERDVVQNLRVTAPRLAKPARMVGACPPSSLVVFAPNLSAFDDPLG